MFWTKLVEQIKTHIFSIAFFNHAFLMWKSPVGGAGHR
jgi:hypothetical protein